MRRFEHHHNCSRCLKGTVRCFIVPERDEDGGGYCPEDMHPDQYACEDCLDLEMCEIHGEWFPREELIQRDGTMMCSLCLEADLADEDEHICANAGCIVCRGQV